MSLILGSSLVDYVNGPLLCNGHRLAPLVGADLRDAVADALLVVVVLEGGLDGEGMGGGVLGESAFDIHGGQVTAKRHGPGADDGIQGESQFPFEVVEAQQPHFQDQLGTDDAIVERRVAPGKEHSLVRQVPVLHILLHNAFAIEYVLHVLD